uniref:Uncharacterized protein n=2 Tax=Lygus hesperus TaxID=30085 RepID=A0A0A9X7A3_LYGHE
MVRLLKEKKRREDFVTATCKYVKPGGGPTTGCKKSIIEEKTVCYCTDEEQCETDPELRLSGCKPCGEYQTPGPCQTRTVVDNCRADCVQPGGKVLFTAALTQEMLIQLARNGVDMANCIPTKNQYLIDCQSLPCAPGAVESTCRVYNNCDQSLRSPCANNLDCTTTTNCSDTLDCRKVGEMNCPPYQRCNVYTCQAPQNNRVTCRILPDCTKVYDVDCEPCCHRNSFQDCSIPCGHICIQKGAVPDCAGDMSRSRRWSPAQERLSSIQENLNIYSSSRKTSDPSRLAGKGRPSRLSDERTSDLVRSSETADPKRPSDLSSLTMNPWAYCGPGIETDGEACKEERKKKKAKSKNEPRDSARKRSSRPTEPTKHHYRERSRSRSPSPIKSAKSSRTTRDSAKTVKSSHGHSSPPHFDDIEPSSKPIVTAKSGYEADLMEAMERVKRRYMEHNYDTTGSSSRATTTEHCKTPTIKEFMGLTEQIKCLRKELRKYCKSDCP